MASDVKWIKITTDIFDDEKVLMIESMPSSDSIIVIWFKLLVLAGTAIATERALKRHFGEKKGKTS